MLFFFANRCRKHIFWLGFLYILGCFQPLAQAQNIAAPVFTKFSIEETGQAVIIGHAPAFSQVELFMGARKFGSGKTDGQGIFTIILQDFSKTGVFQFVLRATIGDGRSIASTETANIVMVGQKPKELIAYVQKADGTKKFISENPQILKANFKNNIDFDIQYISYRNGALSIIGHSLGQSKTGAQIMLSIGKLRIGREKISENGSFIFIRIIPLPASDQIFRIDLLSELGEVVATLGVPFQINNQQRIYSQIYKDGQPIRTILVEKGDTLSSLAIRYYGDIRYIDGLYSANHDRLADKHHLKIGQELLLPDLSQLFGDALQFAP